MAEEQTNTLTIDSTPDIEIVSEVDGVQLSSEEKDSLDLGEKIQAEQENLLAGKYKDAADLEKAYIELQKKLGDNEAESKTETEVESETEEIKEEEATETTISEGAQLLTTASDEYYSSDGKLSQDTIDKISNMDSKDLVQAYLEIQSTLPQNQGYDLPDSAVTEIQNLAGGEEAYTNMMGWAAQNLDPKSISAFDSIVSTGSPDAIAIAVSGLKAKYQDATGYEGKMVTGKAPTQTRDTFRSQAELVRAMSDRRYDNDPAYRQDVIAKLERSDQLQF